MRVLLILGIVIASMITGISQDTRPVRFEIRPSNAILKVDAVVIDLKEQPTPFNLDLTIGKHEIQVWAPVFELVKDSLTVTPEGFNRYSKGLVKQSEAYLSYKKELSKYHAEKFKETGTKVTLIAGNALALWFFIDGGSIRKLSSLEEKLSKRKRIYLNSVDPQILASARIDYNNFYDRYQTEKKILLAKRLVGIPLVAVSSFFSYKKLKMQNANKPVRPEFSDESPFSLNSFELESDDFGNFCLNLKFVF